MDMIKISAIDIGSNAVRLLTSHIINGTNKENTIIKKGTLIRLPIRLGSDVFSCGKILPNTQQQLIDCMFGFAYLMKAQGVVKYKAIATSAMRDANNKKEVIESIAEKTGIAIEIITGELEANLLSRIISTLPNINADYQLTIDVGGGSTELNVIYNKRIIHSESFNVGTLRAFIKGSTTYNELKLWIKSYISQYNDMVAIGTGGNINKTFKLSRNADTTPLTLKYLKEQQAIYSSMTVDERILKMDLNPDRADVIVPALEIYTKIMKWAGIDLIYVPRVGLSDCIVKVATEEWQNQLL